MPELTRRQSTDAREECWHVYYGDVHVGTIVASACQRAGKRLGAALFVDQKLRKHRGSVRMRVVCAAAMIVMLAGPAYAQEKPIPKYGEETKDKTPQEKEGDKAAQRAYERSLGNIPDKGPTDPWGQVRTDAPKATAKIPAAKKPPAKTGSTAN
jgi:hypothetical protein